MARFNAYHGPLPSQAVTFLTWATGIDFTATRFDDECWLCISVWDGLEPVVVMVFEFKSPFDAFATVACSDPRALSRRLLTGVFRAVFQRAARITCAIAPENTVAMKQIWRFGFQHEGYLRRGYDGVRDAVLWGLLPEDCPYLMGRPFRYRTVVPTHTQATRIQ